MSSALDVYKYGNYLRTNKQLTVAKDSGICYACGAFGPYKFKKIINNTLAKEWNLNRTEQDAFSARESMFCQFCGCSYRLRMLAKALVLQVSNEFTGSLLQAIQKGLFDKVRVAEINSCGVLHDITKNMPNLQYSEYGSKNPNVPDEDLTKLTYKDDSFDIVIHSDTLEHVPNIDKSLKEIKRVLSDNGSHVFTVPARLDKLTVTRTQLVEDKTTHKKPKSYHGSGEDDYLVWNEFGADFVNTLKEVFATVEIYFLNKKRLEDPSFIFVTKNTKQDISKKASSDSEDYIIDDDWQKQRLEYVFNKHELTQDHVDNLEDINSAQDDHIKKLDQHIKILDAETRRIRNNPVYRAGKKLNRTIKN